MSSVYVYTERHTEAGARGKRKRNVCVLTLQDLEDSHVIPGLVHKCLLAKRKSPLPFHPSYAGASVHTIPKNHSPISKR